jgi:hypothetical protein
MTPYFLINKWIILFFLVKKRKILFFGAAPTNHKKKDHQNGEHGINELKLN